MLPLENIQAIPNGFQKLNFGQGGCSKFLSVMSDLCLWQGTNEDKNVDAKPTKSNLFLKVIRYIVEKTKKIKTEMNIF
jgi:hypothetical protein